MKKLRYRLVGLLLGIWTLLFGASCGSGEAEVSFPAPIRPETLIADEIVNQEGYCEMKHLPWYTNREDVRKAVEAYELVRENELDDWYRMEAELEDGTRVQTMALFGYMDQQEGTKEAQPLVMLGIQIFIEESDGAKAKNLAETMTKTLDRWAEEDGEKSYTTRLNEYSMQLVKKETNACIAVMCYPNASEERAGEYPFTDLKEYSMILVELWPMNRWHVPA